MAPEIWTARQRAASQPAYYSCRSATAGSTRIARAIGATSTYTAATPESVVGSVALTLYRRAHVVPWKKSDKTRM